MTRRRSTSRRQTFLCCRTSISTRAACLFLGHSFGLPVIAADVGSLKDDIVEGQTGFVFRPEDPADLAKAIERYFASDLYANLNSRRQEIRDYATERHSWDVVARITMNVYAGLLRLPVPGHAGNCDVPGAPLDAHKANAKAPAESPGQTSS